MVSFKSILSEIEREARKPLVEANVINVKAIDAQMMRLAKEVQPDEGKQYFLKKVRSYILNNEELLEPVNATADSDLPEFAKAALQRGESLFSFSPNSPAFGAFTQHLAHLRDWFNALARVAKSEPKSQVEIEDQKLAVRELSKLMKMSPPEAEQRADEWFVHMGTRAKGTKEGLDGVDVVLEWPDGFYAVRFTKREAMIKDGKELQNCLAQAYYWEPVARGEQVVYSIRKPNDEAVVGIRILISRPRATPAFQAPGETPQKGAEKLELAELKGKNNKPVTLQYQQYCADLLTKLGVVTVHNHDLEAAGLVYSGGRYGTFKDVAEHKQAHGYDVYWSDEKFIVYAKGRPALEGTLRGGKIVQSKAVEGVFNIIPVLNALGLPPTPEYNSRLAYDAIFYNNGQYGTAKIVGDHLGKFGGIDLYKVEGRVFGFRGEESVVSFGLAKARVSSMSTSASTEAVIVLLNAMRLKPTPEFETKDLASDGIFFDGRQFGMLDQIGQAEATDPDGRWTIYRLGKLDTWIISYGLHSHSVRAVSKDGELNVPNMTGLRGIEDAVRTLVKKNHFKSVKNSSAFGVLNTSVGAMADLQTFMGHLHEAINTKGGSVPWSLGNELERFLGGLHRDGVPKKQAAQIIDAVRNRGDKAVLIAKNATDERIYDLTIQSFVIKLPAAAAEAAEIFSLPLPQKVVQDMDKAVAEAQHFIAATPDSHFALSTTGGTHAYPTVDLTRAINAANDAVRAKIQDRKNNPNKYNSDLSGRFAALNAFRKKGY